MIPQVQFGFLICSYFPGIPLALALYVSSLNKDIGSAHLTPYLVISPFIIGLFIDALRHAAELLIRCLQNDYKVRNEYLITTDFWSKLPKRKLKKKVKNIHQNFFLYFYPPIHFTITCMNSFSTSQYRLSSHFLSYL